MVDTQKTTKSVREAPTASEAIPICFTEEEIEFLLGYERPLVKVADINSKLREGLEHLEPGPRYTVELTTEGWQIKDNVEGVITASTFGDREKAEREAQAWSELDAMGGQRRR